MQSISATEAKNRLAAVMNTAIKEPVIIEKNGHPFVVMMSVEEYEKKAQENGKASFIALCHRLAATAKQNGMTEAVLRSILNEKE